MNLIQWSSHLKINGSSVLFVFKIDTLKAKADHTSKLHEVLARKYCINAQYLKLIMLEAYKAVHWLKIFSSLNFPMAEAISVI